MTAARHVLAPFLVLGLSCFQSVAYAQQSEAAGQVQTAHEAMLSWLDTGSGAAGWKSYLRSDQLGKQVALGDKADKQVVREILAQYSSGASGLSREQFAAVRRALETWLKELQVPTPETLPQAAREAKGELTPVTDESVQQAVAAARRAVDALDQYLGSGQAGEGWRNYLRLKQVRAQLDNGAKASVDVLADTARRLAREYRGLELPQFTAPRDALADLVMKLRLKQDPQVRQNYQRHLDLLADAWEAYRKGRNPAELQKVAAANAWLRQRGLVPHLTGVVWNSSRKPNLLVELSADVMTYGFNESVNESDRINEWRSGARLRGNARTRGRVVARLVPNEHVAVIHAVMRGRARSWTTAFASRATVYTTGDTSIHAIKQITLGRRGFRDYDTTAAATTRLRTTGLNVRAPSLFRGIAQRVASGRVNSQRRSNERDASRRAERRIKRRMNERSQERIDEANADYYDRFVNPLTDYDAFPSTLRFSTTSTALQVRSIQAKGAQLAALSDPPPPPSGKSLTIRVHESWLNNTLSLLYAGRTLKEEEFRDEITDLLGETPEQLERRKDKPPWTLTFADEAPFTLRFDTNMVIFTLRGTRFRSGQGATRRIPMNITAAYNVAKGPKLVRRGDIQVLPPNIVAKLDKDADGWLNPTEQKAIKPGLLNARQVGLQGELLEDFAEMLDKQIEPEPRKLTGRWEPLGELTADYLAASGRWMTVGYSLEKSGTEKAEPVAVRERDDRPSILLTAWSRLRAVAQTGSLSSRDKPGNLAAR